MFNLSKRTVRFYNGVFNLSKRTLRFYIVVFNLSERDSKRNFKWPLIQQWQYPIHNGTFQTFLWSIMWKKFSLSRFEKLKIWEFLNFFLPQKCAGHFCGETIIEKNQFSMLKICISNSYLIKQRFYGYRCESSIGVFYLCREGHLKLCFQSL